MPPVNVTSRFFLQILGNRIVDEIFLRFRLFPSAVWIAFALAVGAFFGFRFGLGFAFRFGFTFGFAFRFAFRFAFGFAFGFWRFLFDFWLRRGR